MPPLMLRAFELTIINICFDWLRNEVVDTKTSSFQQKLRRLNGCKVRSIRLGQLLNILFFLNFDGGFGCRPLIKYVHMYKFEKHTCEHLKFKVH